MKNIFKILLTIIVLGLIVVLSMGLGYVFYLKKAHSTFDNYYNFRGCVVLLEKTDSYGVCKNSSGQVVKIVKFQDRWYLDGDLPCGFLCF